MENKKITLAPPLRLQLTKQTQRKKDLWNGDRSVGQVLGGVRTKVGASRQLGLESLALLPSDHLLPKCLPVLNQQTSIS